jgi:hypothetical protein
VWPEDVVISFGWAFSIALNSFWLRTFYGGGTRFIRSQDSWSSANSNSFVNVQLLIWRNDRAYAGQFDEHAVTHRDSVFSVYDFRFIVKLTALTGKKESVGYSTT